MKVNVGLPKKAVDTIAQKLVVLLADIHQLYVKSLGYHWNVEDPRFLQLHLLFEAGYKELAEDMDLIAERLRMLGHPSPESIKELDQARRLKDTQKVKGGDKMIAALAADYEFLSHELRKDIEAATEASDIGTADTLTEVLRQFEKRAWFLRSHLPG